MRPVSENMTSRGSKRPPFFPRNYTARDDFSAYELKIPSPGSLQVVNSCRTTGESQFQEVTVVTFTLLFHMFYFGHLLILDGHGNHVMLEALEHARDIGLDIITLSSHTSHAL
jgi:hypothetical protein